MRPVLSRLRAIRPNCLFLKPAISLPPPMKRVARIVPSTVWTVHTAKCSLRFRSTAQIFVSALVLTCSSMVAGLLNFFSTGVCSHHCLPCRISEGLPISTPAGKSRPVMRTLIQLQHVPVQTLSMRPVSVRPFHCPAYRGTDFFQERGGTGGRSLNGFPVVFGFDFPLALALACAFSLCFLHLERWEEKERADPRAALIAARRNMAGASPTCAESGMTGAG